MVIFLLQAWHQTYFWKSDEKLQLGLIEDNVKYGEYWKVISQVYLVCVVEDVTVYFHQQVTESTCSCFNIVSVRSYEQIDKLIKKTLDNVMTIVANNNESSSEIKLVYKKIIKK